MIISFITPVLDEEKFLKFLIKRINEKYNKFDFEWIFVDDHSTDKSYQILSDFSKGKQKIKLLKNSGKGKIDAINLGVKTAQGKFIKLVGADDEIDLDLLNFIDNKDDEVSYVHKAKIVDENYKNLGNYVPSFQLLYYDLDKYILNNISCPSWCWIFPRSKAEKFFPIPKCEYEDLYLSFCIKKFTKIKYIERSFYLYRQNQGQTFGHILKYNKKIGDFRNKRSLKSLTEIKNSSVFNLREKYLISKSRLYFILYLKKKNFFEIFSSKLSLERKLKLIIFRYFNFFYGILQLIKYKFDSTYHNLNKGKKKPFNKKLDSQDFTKKKENSPVCCIKSCLDYPTSDGFTLQYYDALDYICSTRQHEIFLFCKKNFDQTKFLKQYKNIKNVKFVQNFPETFSIMILSLIPRVILHKLGKKFQLFANLENISNNNYTLYIHDISLYPLLFLNLKKINIIFSVTDFQTNRLLKMLKISKGFNFFYYIIGLVHCFFVESLIFRNIKKLHVYSNYDKQIMQKYFLIKNSISIPNFKLDQNVNNNVSKFENNKDKIFIVGDLNQEEIFQGLKKLINTKYFNKFINRYNFVIKGNYSITIQSKIKKMINNVEFYEKWLSNDDFINYLDSFKILLFVDSIAFGLSNRVLDALKSNTLIVGFKESFTGYNLKNFESVIYLDNFYDLVYAYNLSAFKKKEITMKAKNISKKFSLSNVQSEWDKVL